MCGNFLWLVFFFFFFFVGGGGGGGGVGVVVGVVDLKMGELINGNQKKMGKI